ncbi:hypothetical protein BDZ89DRAFT_1158527 [Hymenopellis radicata]|nr:hypothetical protein BDZ89DRAFT_1158527 [Hymenopellis radicata]
MADRKRQKTGTTRSKKTTARNAGKRTKQSASRLKDLSDLPYDTLLEIFSYLLPLDLLNLSWVNQSLRGVLMTKSSRSVWKAARKNAQEMPEPFPGMSEPAWACLVFVKKCNVCWKKSVKSADLYLRCRLCPACSETLLVRQDEDRTSVLVRGNYPFDVKFLMLVTHGTTYGHSKSPEECALMSDYDAIEAELSAGAAKADPEGFAREKFKKNQEIYAHAGVCEKWQNRCNNAREKEIQQMKRNRKQAIRDRLCQLGYTAELRIMSAVRMQDAFDNHPFVKKSQPLTDRIWANISDEMIAFAEQLREKRLLRDRRALVVSRRKVAIPIFLDFKSNLARNQPASFYPSIADFIHSDSVKAIIEDPGDAPVSEVAFAQVVPQMREWFSAWRIDVHSQLLKIANSEPSTQDLSPEATIKRLQLVSCGVICDKCTHYPTSNPPALFRRRNRSTTLFYPDYLTHTCAHSQPDTDLRDILRDLDDGALEFGRFMSRRPFHVNVYKRSPVVQPAMEAVVRLVGLELSTATVDDMDSADCLFECGVCTAAVGEEWTQRQLYGWRQMIRHVPEEHFLNREAASESITAIRAPSDVPSGWHVAETLYESIQHECLHCRDCAQETRGGLTYEELTKHFRQTHNNDLPVEGVDYQRMLGMPSQPRRMEVHLKRQVLRAA